MNGTTAVGQGNPAAQVAALPIAEQRRLLARLLEPRRAPRPRTFAASYQQEGLWFLHQLDPGAPAYNVPIALRVEGSLSRGVLARSLRELVRRHWTLRSAFSLSAGGLQQAVSPLSTVAVPLPVQDLSHLPRERRERELRRRLHETVRRPFDLARAPLLRACLLPLAAGEQVVCLVVHHTVFDGWSMGVLVRELTALYQGGGNGGLPEPPLQYVDFAQWQRERVGKGALAAQLAYWREALRSLPGSLELPTDKPRPARWSFRGGACPLALPADLHAALARLGREAGASLFMTLLAGLAALLGRLANQPEVAIGTPLANRNRSELEGLIGFLANTLVLRAAAPRGATFPDLLGEVRRTALAAYAHQDLPFEKLVAELRPERDLSRSPLFQVMFSLHNAPLPPIALPGATFHVLDVERTTARFDLLFELWETPHGLRGLVEYSSDLFVPATVARLAHHLRTLLAAIAADPRRPLLELPLLAASERHQLVVEWNDTAAAYGGGPCLHDLVAAQAARTPEAPAVRCAAVGGG
ncbi:MAG TPA: condensation domain-containing protein, partial [Thermoanaerobaculia bacterium]|nr:condensation domain-containing protein [Thermoanaerobaculia bacterium]